MRVGRIWFAICVMCAVLAEMPAALAQPQDAIIPDPVACPAVSGELGLRPEHAEGEAAWSACERWVWSCIREGKEANLFVKRCELWNPQHLFPISDL